MENIDRNKLYQDFLQEFPLESLATMSLEKYTNLNRKDSFCYWIESKTYHLGSFWGGSSYKFGIYKYHKKPDDTRIQNDEEYAWYKWFGKNTAQEAFELVRNAIVKVANYARNQQFDLIDSIDVLGDAYKWKIAFLYSNKMLVPIYKKEMLEKVARYFGMEKPEVRKIHELQQFIFGKKAEQELFDFYEKLIPIIDADKSNKSYWLYAPGEGASKWDLCQSQNLVCIGWEDLGNLEQYEDQEAIRESLKEIYQNSENSFKNDMNALWDFAHTIKIGDVIYVKGGQHKLLGRGIVESDYSFDDSFDDYNNIRKVKWTHIGEWKVEKALAQKTLTNITQKKEDIKYYESLLNEGCNNKGDVKYWWLNANPSIFSTGISWTVGSDVEYTLLNDSGHKRRIYQNYLDAKAGDKVICYESTPTKQIVGLAEVTFRNDTLIGFRKVANLPVPIDYADLKLIPEIQGMEFFVNPNGSFFKLTDDEYEVIMDLISNSGSPLDKSDVVSYSEQDFLNEVFMSKQDMETLEYLLKYKKNVILQGAPGVGKTFSAKRLAYKMMGMKDEHRICMVQFHQNYSYEDFVLGYKPVENGFKLQEGKFYNFCVLAANDPDNDYFFIIDEINRGNISKIFGELLMAIESGYRGTKIRLAYGEKEFSIPKNLNIIGMMNTADRSIALIDYALRRRFSFFKMRPGFDTEGFVNLQKKAGNEKLDRLVETVKSLNLDIAKDASLGEGFQIGHSYFCKGGDINDMWLSTLVEYDLIPMLEEYWFDNEKEVGKWSELLRMAIE